MRPVSRTPLALAALILTVAAPLLWAADPPIRLPVTPAPEPPVVRPDAAVRLTADLLYMVDSDLPLAVLCSPPGVLTVTAEEGPLKVRGVFAGGPGTVQTKTFKGKYIYTIEVTPGRSGPCELILVPLGVKAESEIVRRLIDAGDAPRPPPKPEPDPKPDPDPPVTPAKLIVLVIESTDAAAATRGSLFADQTIAARMAEKGHRWRIVAQTVVGPDGRPPADLVPWLNRMAGRTAPQLFLVDEQGRTRVQQDLPKSPADLLALIKKAGG